MASISSTGRPITQPTTTAQTTTAPYSIIPSTIPPSTPTGSRAAR
ncbi:hypothetical protein [Plantactinospora veratri]